MTDIFIKISDFICGYPLFIVLVGGGLFLFIYSGAIPFRRFGAAVQALRHKPDGEGQISSFQALMTTISSTVGMGNIAGVAIAICMGGPGAIFWMWVSAIFGMATKFFEGTLSIMYRDHDEDGNIKGGPMYVITKGLGEHFKPLATCFAAFGTVGCFCVMQANQLTEVITTVITEPAGIQTTTGLKAIIGLILAGIVTAVIIGGIKRISNIATKIVPFMVGLYFVLVFAIILSNPDKIPGAFASILRNAFDLRAGFGGLAGIAIIGARRAMFVNEAGVGTASLMHSYSRNNDPIREGLVAMLGPAIDSGLVCTLTAIPILIAGNFEVEGVKGLAIALDSFETMLPGWGGYLLTAVVTIFAFSTMFSYSVYGVKCSSYLFGERGSHYYRYLYLAVILLSCIVSLKTVVSIMDLAFALMAFINMSAVLVLCPRVKRIMKSHK